MFWNKRTATIGAFLLTGAFILLEHLNGGVVSHHVLAREDLPGVSNLWGLLTVPALTWITFFFINRRKDTGAQSDQDLNKDKKTPQIRFLYALVFGIAVSILWEVGFEEVLQYVILLPFLIALFKPVHFPECLLGFVIGMLYTFGGILPIMIGLVVLVGAFIIHSIMNLIKTIFVTKGNTGRNR